MEKDSNTSINSKSFLSFLFICFSAVFLLTACENSTSLSKKTTALKVGCSKGNSSSLIYLAQEKGFFQDESLKVEILEFQSGVGALNAFFRNEVDMVTASEFAFVSKSFQFDDIYILASIASYKNKALLARKDSNIVHPSDLKGKRIAVTANSGGEYFLGQFLDKHSISRDEVEIIYMKAKPIIEKFIAGEIDATLIWEPHVYHAKKLMSNEVTIWDAQEDQLNYLTLITDDDFLSENQESTVRFLRGLKRAENHHKQNPQSIEEVLHNRFLYDPDYLASVFQNTRFKLEISEELLKTLSREAEWRIEKGLSKRDVSVNYKTKLYTKSLKVAAPESVSFQN